MSLLGHSAPGAAICCLRRISSSSSKLLATSATGARLAPRRHLHLGLLFVPQQQCWVIERFGKFNRLLSPGLNWAIPLVETIAYKQSLKEIIIEIDPQPVITHDNVTLEIDGVLFAKVRDPYASSYGVDDPENGIIQLSQTNLRAEVGKINLDVLFQERQTVSNTIVNQINLASQSWGIECLRYEIRNVKLPEKVKDAMQQQVEAEREKRALILRSEAQRESAINVASGNRESKILESEARRIEQINEAEGESKAFRLNAEAQANALEMIGHKLAELNNQDAAKFSLAMKYMESFGNVAQKCNTVILPSDMTDGNRMITQGISVFNALSKANSSNETSDSSVPESVINNDVKKEKSIPKISGKSSNLSK
ncbi:MAG: Stomatin-like protein 2, mitochondrial [Marteilia pararefringens]